MHISASGGYVGPSTPVQDANSMSKSSSVRDDLYVNDLYVRSGSSDSFGDRTGEKIRQILNAPYLAATQGGKVAFGQNGEGEVSLGAAESNIRQHPNR